MTPAARVQAAIDILDQINDGFPAEQTLTRWARANRYAGSKDRRAVRDHVFDVLRVRRSVEARGGGTNGRSQMLGLLRLNGVDEDSIFTGAQYAPQALNDDERVSGSDKLDQGAFWNLPEWLMPKWEKSLGEHAEQDAVCLQTRAPVFVRVNLLKSNVDDVIQSLSKDGITAELHALVPTALKLTAGATALRQSRAYADGMVELQDAASQSVVADLPETDGPILDYCAGGGGKTLALAGRFRRKIDAWDVNPDRMRDLPARAARSGAEVKCLSSVTSKSYDLVLCDAPCSGSGSWRRSPDAKWRFKPEDLERLSTTQDRILDAASKHVAQTGTLVYATCSVLRSENEDRVSDFIARNPKWRPVYTRRWRLNEVGDGFFAAHFKRD